MNGPEEVAEWAREHCPADMDPAEWLQRLADYIEFWRIVGHPHR